MRLKRILPFFLVLTSCGLLQERRPKAEEDRLLFHSLRPIASEEQLEEFFALPPRDRDEWLRRFWKEFDPTPTTEENERKAEHERRVAHALEHYSTQFWGRPWDDRGDAYIKFGEPDDKVIRLGEANCEIWYYCDYKPELALQFDEASLEDYYHLFGRLRSPRRPVGHGASEYLQSLLVRAATAEAQAEAKKPKYEYDLDTSLPYYCEWSQFGGEDGKTRVELLYALPVQELDFSDGRAEIGRRATVFDQAYREIVSTVGEKRVGEDVLRSGDLLIGTLDLSVSPGDYVLGFRLEDLKSNRMGILKSEFTARDFSQLSLSDLRLESPIRLIPQKRKGELPLRRVFKKSRRILLDYEIYNLLKSPLGRTWYETEYEIRAHKKGVGHISSTFEGRGDSPTVRNKLHLDLSASPPGDYDLVVRVRDMIGKREASASTTLTLVE